jgi:hypothetical protein
MDKEQTFGHGCDPIRFKPNIAFFYKLGLLVVGVKTFGMSTSVNTNNQWGYKDGLVSVWK